MNLRQKLLLASHSFNSFNYLKISITYVLNIRTASSYGNLGTLPPSSICNRDICLLCLHHDKLLWYRLELSICVFRMLFSHSFACYLLLISSHHAVSERALSALLNNSKCCGGASIFIYN